MEPFIILLINMLWVGVVAFGISVARSWALRSREIEKDVDILAKKYVDQAALVNALKVQFERLTQTPVRKANF